MSRPVGVDVHYVIDEPGGAGAELPAVVLSNSLGSTASMWERQVPALAERFRVVRYDTRGHGRSPVPDGPYEIDDLADDLVTLLDRLELDRVHLVGLSLGGMTAMRVAARNPERVDRVVVLCTSALLGPAAAWQQRAATVRAEGTTAVAEAVVGRWYTSEFAEANPERIDRARTTVASTPAEGYASCCEAIASMDLTGDLPTITAPLLAIAGAEDPATPPAHLERIATQVHTGRLMVVPKSAHLANDEQPATVTTAVLEHLTGAPFGRRGSVTTTV